MPVRPFNCKPRDLSQCVNTGICPPRPEHPYGVAGQAGQGCFKFRLNRRYAPPLSLETEIGGSIVLNGRPISSGCLVVAYLRLRLHTY